MPLALADTASDVPMSARTRKFKNTLIMGGRGDDLLGSVERHMEVLSSKSDGSEVEDVRRILKEVRAQYDHVHLEAERREAELLRLKRAIAEADVGHGDGAPDSSKKEDRRLALEGEIDELNESILRAKEARKVYTHMGGRIQKEQSLLKEKLLVMEGHLGRKNMETSRKVALQERVVCKGAQVTQELERLEQVIEYEDRVRKDAIKNMKGVLESRSRVKNQRDAFEEWRRNNAQEAANEAFNASAGRLRKLYAIEKLAGNCLQKITFEQVERSQTTEDGFQKIREVTGLTDVMDIVHKFLSREEEHEQLKSSVKEAEAKRDMLHEQFKRFKRDTNGMTDPEQRGEERALYREVEESENLLNQSLNEHEQSRVKLQQSTLQVEHMKRWANRVGRTLTMFEDCVKVEKPADLQMFYHQLSRGVDKFIAHIVQLISSGRVQRKNMSQAASKEYHEARRLLADKEFLKANCRVPASLDAGRPSSKGKASEEKRREEEQKENEELQHQQEREEIKKKALDAAKGRGRVASAK